MADRKEYWWIGAAVGVLALNLLLAQRAARPDPPSPRPVSVELPVPVRLNHPIRQREMTSDDAWRESHIALEPSEGR